MEIYYRFEINSHSTIGLDDGILLISNKGTLF